MNDVMMKLRYPTHDRYDSPKGCLEYFNEIYERITTPKLAQLEQETTNILCEKNERKLAEYVLAQVFELAEDHADSKAEYYQAHVWRFDVIQIWNEIFVNKIIWDYINKKDLENRAASGFKIQFFYMQLEEVFKQQYHFRSNYVLPAFCRENETQVEAKKRFDQNMYIGDVKLSEKNAEKTLLGVKFRDSTGLRFIAEKQGNHTKICLYKKNQFLWSEIIYELTL
jgi:hypothetical protein